MALAAWLALAVAAPVADGAGAADFAAAEPLFERGEFGLALRQLDLAASRATDPHLLGQVFLLRGRCAFALNDPAAAALAFGEALGHDPTLSLDPSRVLPSVVGLLERVRADLRGTLKVDTQPGGATVRLDGRVVGAAPYEGLVGIGKHRVEASWPGDVEPRAQEVVVHPGERLVFSWATAPRVREGLAHRGPLYL